MGVGLGVGVGVGVGVREPVGTWPNTSQPKREAQTKSKNRRDWVAEISATLKAFVKL